MNYEMLGPDTKARRPDGDKKSCPCPRSTTLTQNIVTLTGICTDVYTNWDSHGNGRWEEEICTGNIAKKGQRNTI